jgi:hypothetical protein
VLIVGSKADQKQVDAQQIAGGLAYVETEALITEVHMK